MKKLVLSLFMFCIAIIAKADYYIAYATTNVNLRDCASTECEILARVPKNEVLFVDTEDIVDGFYRVVYVDKDITGYVHSKYIKLHERIQEDNGNILSVSGQSQSYDPSVSVTNNTDVKMTLVLNSNIYHFDGHEIKNITLSPGTIKIRASSPGIIPYVGKDNVLGNHEYTWEFYIITTRR